MLCEKAIKLSVLVIFPTLHNDKQHACNMDLIQTTSCNVEYYCKSAWLIACFAGAGENQSTYG